ncbi:MAG TPA: alpha/beta hydrolase [Gammaproteobacteria bacterium]|nr:alpha/beta hydrolase [Gammaproteobacteria bacterium]
MLDRETTFHWVIAGTLILSAICAPPPNASRSGTGAVEQRHEGDDLLQATSIRSIDIGGGVELSYVEHGTGEPVVLVHGSLADLSYWEQAQQIGLLGVRYRVIAYSRRYNHPNRNVPTGDHSPLVEAADLVRLLDALETGPVHLVGHSYGAYTALALAIEHPARLRTLVLAEPPIISWLPDISGGEGILEEFMARVWEPLATAFRDGGDEGGLDFTARWYFGVPYGEVEPSWQKLFRDNVAEWRELAVSPATFPELDYDRVRGLRVPTLLLSGGKNAGGFNDLVDRHLHHLIPESERIIIPDASHEMFLDFPKVTAEAMLRHFARHRGAH